MGNWLSKFGAQSSKPVRYGILWQNRMSTGIWTQRSPLRDAASTRIEEEFYGARGDAMIDGLNTEISAKLTLIRRPGTSIYNSNTYPSIRRFYGWNLFNYSTEKIKVLADTANAIYDVTGPGTSNPSPTPLFTKSLGAGSTYFQSVGNLLYFSDGVDSKKVVGSLDSWSASTTESEGLYIIDPNGNIQLVIGSQTASITDIEITSPSSGVYLTTLFFSSFSQLTVPIGTKLTISGMTTVPALNGTTQTITNVVNGQQIQFVYGSTILSYQAETGSATTGTGTTGLTQPIWETGLGSVTQDGGSQWENRGSQIQNWGIAASSTTPTVTQASAPSIYPSWSANTWYSPLFVILDTNGNLQQLTTGGKTGAAAPAWATVVGTQTPELSPGTAVWTCKGPGGWLANTAYSIGSLVQATFTYYITVPQYEQVWVSNPYSGGYWSTQLVYVQEPVTVTCLFQCSVSGTSGAYPPSWINGNLTKTTDNTVQWTNQGTASSWPGSSQTLSLATQIIDSNNNLQDIQRLGKSGAAAPSSWATSLGAFTIDNTALWLNNGAYGKANTGAWIYAYSGKNSVTGTIGTSDPQSAAILVSAGNLVVVQGGGFSDPQVDTIVIWRTVQGGSVLFYLDEIPNPGGGLTWTYTDTTPDTGLNELIEAPIAGANNPPPTGLSALTYHLGLIWGAVNNSVYYSSGGSTTAGNGDEAWPSGNVFVFPSAVIRLFPMTNGLLVFTISDIYIIQGLNTTSSPLFSTPFLSNIGLVSYDAFAVNGSIVFLYTSDNQVISLDPSSGVSEVGFPIGDQFGPDNGTKTFNPTSSQITWHIAGSQDKGLYVSDFSGTWWRMCPTPSPESGTTWSPKAQIVGGLSAAQSIEVLPGARELLVGPKTNGPILKRDYTVYSDNGSAYNAFAVFGSLVLAQPGQIAFVESFTTDSILVGSPLSLAAQLDEISPLSAGYFESLATCAPDPPELSPSNSIYAQRFYISQTQKPALCRHLQIQVDWGYDTVKNELLGLSLFGGFEQEK